MSSFAKFQPTVIASVANCVGIQVRRTRRGRMYAVIVALVGSSLAQVATAQAAAGCSPTTFLIDTTGSVRTIAAIWGEAPGQTFIAEDTLVTSITVWRWAVQSPNDAPMKLWITEVDSTGRPRNNRVVFEGPWLQVIYGDGVHPIEIRYELDPPAVLPRRGKFAFFIQNPCSYFFDLLVREGTAYAEGELWRSEIAIYQPNCPLYTIIDRFDERDLCCKIEFCDVPTPVKSPTWGRVKSIYR